MITLFQSTHRILALYKLHLEDSSILHTQELWETQFRKLAKISQFFTFNAQVINKIQRERQGFLTFIDQYKISLTENHIQNPVLTAAYFITDVNKLPENVDTMIVECEEKYEKLYSKGEDLKELKEKKDLNINTKVRYL